jgi:hypothetical protein
VLPRLKKKKKLRTAYDAKRGNHVVMVQSGEGLFGEGSDILRIVRVK